MLYSGGASCTPVGIRHTISPVLRLYFTISDHGGADAVIDPPVKLMFMKLTGDVNWTCPPLAASTSSLAFAISSAFCSGVTIVFPPPRPPPPPPPPPPRPAPGIEIRIIVGNDLWTM